MLQENAHVKKLIAARERMIQDRRNLADALASEYKGGHTERMRDGFIVTQNAIEAIDRAIAHETYRQRKAGIDNSADPVWSVRSRAI
jgi:hypothetical protein